MFMCLLRQWTSVKYQETWINYALLFLFMLSVSFAWRPRNRRKCLLIDHIVTRDGTGSRRTCSRFFLLFSLTLQWCRSNAVQSAGIIPGRWSCSNCWSRCNTHAAFCPLSLTVLLTFNLSCFHDIWMQATSDNTLAELDWNVFVPFFRRS